MNVSIDNKLSVVENIGLKNSNPTPASSLKKINVPDIFGDDGLIQTKIKKVNNSGSNPFGATKIIDNEKSLTEGIPKKIYSNFDEIDNDRNGFLSRKEIVSKMRDNNFKNEKSAVIATLVINDSKIKNLSNDEIGLESSGVTKNDLVALDKLSSNSSLKNQVEGTYYNSLYKSSSSQSYFDQSGKLILPKKASDIKIEQVNQGGAGDCYFLAALASVAQREPQKIVDMIKDNQDGTYNVKFNNKEVKVNAPTSTELGLYGDGAGWMVLLEKAYAVYRNDGALLKKENPYDKSGSGSLLVGRGITDITGNSSNTDILLVTTKGSTRTKLIDAEKNNKLMTASINKNFVGKPALNLPTGHVYTVMGYDSQTDKIKIRNPWGNSEAQEIDGITRDGNDDGIFELSTDEFYKVFDRIAYENK